MPPSADPPARPLRLFIVAGEPSGDALGGGLIAALRRRWPELDVRGVGGERMAAAGLRSLFPMADLAVMGIAEIVPRLPLLIRRWRETAASAIAFQPDAVVTIDSSGFSKGLAKRLIRGGLAAPRIHYVAPMVWAWRPGRAGAMARLFDHLLTLFPFEPELFDAAGLPATWVGHPLIDEPAGDAARFRARLGIPTDRLLLCLLPGSRLGEARRLLPVLREATRLVAEGCPDLHVVLPTVPALAALVAEQAATWPVPATVVVEAPARRDAMAASEAALAASGSVTLELALAGVPMAIAYKVSAPTAAIVRRLIRVPHVGLPNLLLGRGLVGEYLQEHCTPDALAGAALRLLTDQAERERQRRGFTEIRAMLGRDAAGAASERAADVVLKLAMEARRDADSAARSPRRLDR